MSLNEAWEGHKKDQDDLREMHLKNLDLSKEYAQSVEHGYIALHASFENDLR